MGPWFTSALYVLVLLLFNSMKHQAHFFFYLSSLEELFFLSYPMGRSITRCVLAGYPSQGDGFGEENMKQTCYRIEVSPEGLCVFRFEVLCVGLFPALS